MGPRTVVITGASSGAGRAIAMAFARHGDHLMLASRNLQELEGLAKECEIYGGKISCVETDVSDYHSMINLAAKSEEFGGADIWINNAGILAAGAFEKTPMEISTQVVKTNLIGYMNGVHAILPYFKRKRKGIIINNISIGGFLPVPFGAAYSASKFGLRGFSAAIKAELSSFTDIHICDAFPAFLDTPGIQHAANYTGKQLKPAPPVYDPNRLALAILKLSKNPRSSIMVGSASTLLRLSYALFPTLITTTTAKIISRYLKNAPSIGSTSGNIFNPVSFGNSSHGGWGTPGRPKAHRPYIIGGISMLTLAVLLLLRKH